MGKITSIIFVCANVLWLVFDRSPELNVAPALGQQVKQLSDTDVAASSPEKRLPPAYLVTPMKVLQSDRYSEGVVFDREGNLYFSQTKAGTITVLKPDGSRSIWAVVNGVNGHKVMPDGTHIVAAKNSVVQLDANGKLLKVVAKEFNGKPLQYPNDITIDPQGGFYFTDSGDSNPQIPSGTVYYVNSAGRINSVVSGLAFANGIVLAPDRKRLFVAESRKNRVLFYEVLSQGVVGPQRVFADLPAKQGEQIDNQPDGMCMDATGNLYVAHYGMRQVEVLSPNGQLVRQYSSGNLTTSNCAFGGPNLEHLFVTGGLETENGFGGIFRIDLGVPGLGIRPQR